MRRLVTLALAVLAFLPASAASFSKEYVFRADTQLDIGEEVAPGIRLDSVRFEFPTGKELKILGVGPGSRPRAIVTVTNASGERRTIGVAIACLTGDKALVGVASGGSGSRGTKPNVQIGWSLPFDHVGESLRDAATFRITVETRH